MGPKMVSKWNQDLEKDSAELILDAMKALAKNMMFKKSQEEVSRTARDGRGRPGSPGAAEPGLGAPNKGKT